MSDSKQYQNLVNIIDFKNKFLNIGKIETRKYQFFNLESSISKSPIDNSILSPNL